jgi:hypothetical protein
MGRKATSIDAYLTTVGGEKRAALDKLRKTIRAMQDQELPPLRPGQAVADDVRKLIKARIAEG